jgi:N-dimethylarginine dimethylaminohydrolase
MGDTLDRPAGAAPDPAFGSAAYGGEAWSPRVATHRAEIGTLWAASGIDGEWGRLRTVLLSPPGPALAAAGNDPDANQLLAPVDLARAADEHAAMADTYRAAGVEVLEIPPSETHPNQMFCADLFVMTPEGAILARPASTVRAGEEVAVAAALARASVPILRTLTGTALFEGADLIWVDTGLCLIGLGLRTNAEAARQIAEVLTGIGVEAVVVDMPFGTMHLMGMLRVLDRDLAVAWPRRTPHRAVTTLRERGIDVAFLPDADEAQANRGLNVVALGPRRVLMPAGNDAMRGFYEGLGVEVVETPCFELRKAAGAVGCLTGVVEREMN